MAGYVHEVVLENFKSYGGKIRVGPFKKFTCIVGPNGAGKSNLMEAISFVLGVRSLRHLRSERFLDLVHCKNSALPCSVELVYREPSSSEDLSGEPESLRSIVFRRVIQPASEARFQVDGRSVSEAEYLGCLEAIKILSQAKNFLVFQGDLEAAVQRQGKDLTDFFEKVSGSKTLCDDYDRLRAQKAQGEEDARDLYAKKRNAQNEKKQMSQQNDELTKYRQLEADRNNLQIEYYLFRLHSAEKLAAERGEAIEAARHEQGEAETVLESSRQQLESAEQKRALVHIAVKDAARAVKSAGDRLQKAVPEQIEIKSQLQAAEAQLQELRQQAEQDGKRVQQLETQAAELQQQRSQLEVETRRLQQQQPELPFTPAQHQQFRLAQEQAEQEAGSLGQQAKDIEAQIRCKAKDRINADRDEQEASLRVLHMKQKVEDLVEVAAAAKAGHTQNAQLLEQRRSELEALKARDGTQCSEKQQLELQRRTILEKVQDMTANGRQIERETRLQQISRDIAQVVSGMQGRVVTLCKPVQKRFQVPVNVALGGYMDAIITDTVEGGRQGIQYLKDRMLEPMTFLPLDNLRCPPPDKRLQDALRGHHQLWSALSCISLVDPRVSKAFEFMIGDVVIAANLEAGRRFAFEELRARGISCRIVTLDGETISREGNLAINCDAARQNSTRFNFVELEEKRGLLEGIDRKLCELHSRESTGNSNQAALQAELNRQEVRMQEMTLEHERVSAVLRARQIDLDAAKQAVAEAQPRASRLLEEEEQLRHQLQHIEVSISRKVAGHFKSLSDAMEGKDVQQLFREFKQKREECMFREDALKQQMNSVSAELAMVERSLKDRASRGTAEAVAACEARVTDLQQRDAELLKELHELEEKVAIESKAAREQERAEQKHEQEIVQIRHQFKEQQQRSAELKRHATGLASEQVAAQEMRLKLLQQAYLEDVKLPLISPVQSLRKLAEDMAAEVQGKRGKKPGDALQAAETLEVDFSGLSEEKRKAADGGPAAKVLQEECLEQLRAMERDLEQLQPNLRASKQLEDAEQQALAAEREAQRATKSIEDVKSSFHEIRSARRDRFMVCFHEVQKEIQEIYRILTSTSAGRNEDGGRVFLDLEDLEEPWNAGVKFTAMPPGKRFSDITLLSGGEKTMAVMALLLATRAYQKPPFLVLDEVDAYLDHGNVQALASYLAGISCQAIVISQKDRFFTRGDGLVGVSKSADSSVVFSVDLARIRAARAGSGAARLPAPTIAKAGA
eukprot:TRINITY_DN103598_c0_g1_i1.p1 TRINITY_DN103598_c0_g1~~TRINITY_DN103598_c0_g1_i1.p1  ORF type:complete len:1252 (-),score=375.66 TRINITY_DN103598_c0_g1_i1:383-4138(-)